MSVLLRTVVLVPLFFLTPQLARAGLFEHQESTEYTGDFSAVAAVELKNVNGSVTIKTWDRDEYKLMVTKTSRHEENLELLEVHQDISRDHAKIEVHIPKKKGWFSMSKIQGQVNLELTVPATVDLERISTVNGTVELSDVMGPVIASSVNGRINATNLGGPTRLNTVNGAISASFIELANDADLSFATVNGSIQLRLPEDLHADVQSSVVNGRISCDFPIKLEGSKSGRKLRGQIGNGGSAIAARSVNGSIKFLQR